MNDYVTTVKSNFPVKDITHKPKRMQGDMIRLAESANSTTETPVDNETVSVITLERAISYYKRMSTDSTNGRLFEATAKWLEELLVTRTLKTEAAVKAVIKEENATNGDTEEERPPV